MILFWLAFAVLLLAGARWRRHGFVGDYLSRRHTTAINGFFVGWVFLRHVGDYISRDAQTFSFLDQLFGGLEFLFGQLIVATFLFFSGYGVMTSIASKGRDYVKTFPRKRILKVLAEFDVAVVLYGLVGVALGLEFAWSRVWYSLVAWDDLGNSNWYVFVVLICYASTYLVHGFAGGKNWVVLLMMLAVGCGLFYCKEFVWWDTLLAYPAGMLYCEHKEKAERFFRNHYWKSLAFFVIACVAARCLAKMVGLECPARVFFLNIRTIAFALIVVLAMMKVSFGNSVLDWLGGHLFPLYIYQRLAMLLLKAVLGAPFLDAHPYWYVVCCGVATVCFASVAQKWLRFKG